MDESTAVIQLDLPDEFLAEGTVLTGYTGTESNLIIPEGITEIGTDAFRENLYITSVEIPDGVTVIGTRAFYTCSRLRSVKLPDSITSIGDWAFDGCPLTEIDLPEQVQYMGYNCVNQTQITSLRIPGGVEVVDRIINWENRLLKEIIFEEGVREINGFRDCVALEKVQLPSTLEKLAGLTFQGCRKLEQINIPDKLHDFGFACLLDTPVWEEWMEQEDEFLIIGDGILICIRTDKTSVVLPEEVKYIAETVEIDRTKDYGISYIFSPNLCEVILPREDVVMHHCAFDGHNPPVKCLVKDE